MQNSTSQFSIDETFRSLIPPLGESERAQLEKNIVADGCRDPLVIWKRERVLLDGHNRYEICTRRGIPFKTVEVELPDRDAAEDWIDANQLGRRNLTPDQTALLLGRRYNRAKKRIPNPHGAGGRSGKIVRDQSDPQQSTAERLGTEHGVGQATVKRAGQYAAAVDRVKSIDPEIESKVSAGTAPPRSSVVKAARLLDTAPDKAEAVLRGEITAATAIREQKRTEIRRNLESVEARETKAARGVYDVVVIDPPWPMKKIERDVRPNQSEFDYPTMSEDELAGLTIPAADDCHVWLWTTHKFLPMAFRLLEAWGLKYVCTFVWHKPGGFQPIGLPQYNCEFALYARRGTPSFLDTKAFPTAFDAPRGAHSEKPEEFYDVVRRVTAGRRIDMFNRRRIDGFDTWGKEAA